MMTSCDLTAYRLCKKVEFEKGIGSGTSNPALQKEDAALSVHLAEAERQLNSGQTCRESFLVSWCLIRYFSFSGSRLYDVQHNEEPGPQECAQRENHGLLHCGHTRLHRT